MAPLYRAWTDSGSSWRRKTPPEEKVSDVPTCPLLCLPRVWGLSGPGEPLPWWGSAPMGRLRGLDGPSPGHGQVHGMGPHSGATCLWVSWDVPAPAFSGDRPCRPCPPGMCRGSDRPRLVALTRASSVAGGCRCLCTRRAGSWGVEWRLHSHCPLCVDRALPHATPAASCLETQAPQSALGLRASSMTTGAQPGPPSPGDLQAEGRRVCISWRELSRTT